MTEENKTADVSRGRTRRWVAALAAGVVFFAGLGVGRWVWSSPQPANAAQQKLALIKDYIDAFYLFEPDEEAEITGLCNGLVSALGDPYAAYYTPEELARSQDESNARMVGIGAYLKQNLTTGAIVLSGVVPGGPAAEAGLQPQDLLLAVNGMSTEQQAMAQVISRHIKGVPGTTLSVTVYRPSTDQTLTVLMERRDVAFQMIHFEMLEGQTGYVFLYEFSTNLADEFYDAIDQLTAQGMQQLVLDVRNNPGGDLDAAVLCADYLIPDHLPGEDGATLLVTVEDKHKNSQRYYCNDGRGSELPIAILTNGESASASELLSAALRDNGRALLVGTNTFGKGIVQELYQLEDGSGLKLTTSRYLTPGGFSLHGLGLKPDIPVEASSQTQLEPQDLADFRPSLQEDQQLQAAMDALNQVRQGTLRLPSSTSEDFPVSPPPAFLEETASAKQKHPTFALTRQQMEQAIQPKLSSIRSGQVYCRKDLWDGDAQSGYAWKLTYQTIPDGFSISLNADPLTDALQSVQLMLPTSEGVDFTMELLAVLNPSLQESVGEKIRTALPNQQYTQEGGVPAMDIKGMGCTIYAVQEDGILTVTVAP